MTKGAISAAAILFGTALFAASGAKAQELACAARHEAAVVVTVGTAGEPLAVEADLWQPVRMGILNRNRPVVEANQTANFYIEYWVENTSFVVPCHGWYRIDWSATPAADTAAGTVITTEIRLDAESVARAQSVGPGTSSGFAMLRLEPGNRISIWVSADGAATLSDARMLISRVPYVVDDS